jgi:polysaccharide deacetylase 2 family uncharacterized protein YibQ
MTAPAASRAARALGLAGASLMCLLAASALGITVLGKVHRPEIVMDLSPPPQPHQAAAPHLAAAPAPPPVAIDKIVMAGRALIADPALIENSPQGPLPRVADDGRMPMTAYAAPALSGKFRIAIVVSGLGLSAKATRAALAGLPPAVTLAFAPYASDVQHWISQARQEGHEALLEVPMEPFDFPDSDPGPHTLRAGVERDANGERLAWVLSRATGYAGVTNLLGQRFLADADALSPTLTQLARRGLYFYDDGAVAQSAAVDVAARLSAPFVKANETLDDIQTALEIDRQLAGLETAARAHGSAVGSAFLYPISIERIALWSKGLEKRGFVLVPLSAIVSAPK